MALNLNFAKNKGWNSPAAPSFTSIGSVGSSGQMAAGHVLTSASFPSAAIGSNLSWYNLADLTDASGNGRSFTSPNSNTWGTDILGNASGCLSLTSASSQYLASTSDLFDPGDNNFITGFWFNPPNWIPGADKCILSQYNTSDNKRVFYLNLASSGALVVGWNTNGGAGGELEAIRTNVLSITGWHHIVLKYTASPRIFSLYLDSKLIATAGIASALQSAGAGYRKFNIGTYNSGSGNFVSGSIDEFFFYKGALTDNDIMKIYARKYSHNQNISPVSQKWIFQAQNGGQTRELFDNIVDMQANDLYYDLSDESSTTQVSLRLANIY